MELLSQALSVLSKRIWEPSDDVMHQMRLLSSTYSFKDGTEMFHKAPGLPPQQLLQPSSLLINLDFSFIIFFPLIQITLLFKLENW